MSGHLPQLLAAGDVPQPDCVAQRAFAGQCPANWAECDRSDETESGQLPQLLAVGDVPQPDCVVKAPTGQCPAIRAEAD